VDLAQLVCDIAAKSNVECRDGKSLSDTEKALREEVLQPGDVLLVMGAGDITGLARRMAKT
jgi:UDP-N-acetylmuramate-alanine ligase